MAGLSLSGSVREYPEDLPPPYLRYHSSPQAPASGRAPIRGSSDVAGEGASAIPRMPTAEELAAAPIPEGFRCPLCLDVLDQPTTTVPCGHTFCERCILQSLNNSEECLSPTSNTPCTRCPVCRSVVRKDRLGPCWIVRDLIDSITVRCDYGVSFNVQTETYESGIAGGCTVTFRLGDRSLHLQECGHVMVACSFERDGCQAMSRRGQIRAHEQECIFRSEDCKCGQRVRTQIWEEHQQTCPSVEVRCPHQRHGCGHICMRGDLEDHLSSCPYESLKDLLEEKDRQFRELQRQNLHLESSLWTALKSKQQLEQEMLELRWQAGIDSGSPALPPGAPATVRRSAASAQPPSFGDGLLSLSTDDLLEAQDWKSRRSSSCGTGGLYLEVEMKSITKSEAAEEKLGLARSTSSSPRRGSLMRVLRTESLSGEKAASGAAHVPAERSASAGGGGGAERGEDKHSARGSLPVDAIPPFRGAGQKGGQTSQVETTRGSSAPLGTWEGMLEKVHHAPPEREKNLKVCASNPRHRAIHPALSSSSQWKPQMTDSQIAELKMMPLQQSI